MDLARLLAPRDPALDLLAREVFADRPDLRKAFGDADNAGFHQWLGVHGVLEYPRIAAHYPPLPPEHLRATVCGGATFAAHLYSGAEDFRVLGELFEIYARRPLSSVRSVLDFGCGCGRELRWMQAALPAAAMYGADVRQAAIEWCRQNLRGTFLANRPLPPLDLPDASIDFAYALSVWSHLSDEQGRAWMRELARVVRPDGLILVSTHGAFALALCMRSPEHQRTLQIDAGSACELLRELPHRHFLHRVLPAAIRADADGVADDYGQAFFDEVYARSAFADCAEFVGCMPCGLGLFQDFHAFRPRRR